MASLISAAMGALLEFDEVAVRMIGEDTVEYDILTTGVLPSVIRLKTLIWSYFSPPVKRLDIVSIKEVEPGIVANRYIVTVRGKIRKRLIPRP